MTVDHRTLADLNIFENSKEDKGKQSIFSLFDMTKTDGGRILLREYFKTPKSNLEEIVSFQNSLKTIISNYKIFSTFYKVIDKKGAESVYKYINSNVLVTQTNEKKLSGIKAFLYKRRDENSFYEISQGVLVFLQFIQNWKFFLSEISGIEKDISLNITCQNLNEIFGIREFKMIQEYVSPLTIKTRDLFYLDYLIRNSLKDKVKLLLFFTYEMDVLLSISYASIKYKLTFPSFADANTVDANNNSSSPIFKTTGLYHMLVNVPVKNDFEFENSNFIFLTGPNMAGKTTFLKSIGISILLAHIGIGVPAKSMELSVFDYLASDINTTENILKGYSYFYSEVERIKNISLSLTKYRHSFFIMDELFKGTNVSDAYQSSLSIIKGMSKHDGNLFLLSSHLAELEGDLKKIGGLDFYYFDAKIIGSEINYKYKIKKGISSQRLGLVILKQEGVLDILDEQPNICREHLVESEEKSEFNLDNNLKKEFSNKSNDKKEQSLTSDIDSLKKIKVLTKKLEFIEKLYWWNSK